MKKRVVAAAILFVVLLCLYRGAAHLARPEKPSATGKHNSSSPSSAAQQDPGSPHLPTKVSNRPPNTSSHATHRPEQLKEFFLPEVAIDGLPLKAALAKLLTAYEDVCRESGEVPLHLTFVVPPEATRPLTVKTGLRTLDASIHLLAAMSGLKLSRTGSEYTFTAPDETGKMVQKTFTIPPDFSALSNVKTAAILSDVRPVVVTSSARANEEAEPFSPGEIPIRLSPADYFANKGIPLDPSTKFSLSGSTLQLETASAADQIAVEGLIDVTLNETPLQHKMQSRVIQIPADIDWTPPDLSQLDEAGMQQMMRQLSEKKGVDLLTSPAVTARPGEDAKVEITREVLVPSQTVPGEFEPQPAGLIVDLRSSPYGLGHHVDLNYSERVPEGESGTATAKVTERTSITDSSFSGDGNTHMHIQTHPDGTRSVVLVTPTLIDATGQPLHGKE